ncbi:MAG: hypothetical protein ACHQPI_05850 [Thermoanaerobaculia bacterium]
MPGFPLLFVRLFDTLQAWWNGVRQQRFSGSALAGTFLVALAVIEARREGWLPPALAAAVPTSHFHAVDLAFTLLLVIGVIGVVFSLAHSVSESLGRQLEIFSLILLRQTFKELSRFREPIVWSEVSGSIGHMISDAAGALAVFILVGLFYRLQRHSPITVYAGETESFVRAKKGLALVLLLCFALIGVADLKCAVTGQEVFNFFETFYTLLVISDILLVLISLRYSSTYRVVFRNSGFAVATLLVRLALTAPPYFNAVLGLAATLFACGLTWAYNVFEGSFAATTLRPPPSPDARGGSA